MAFVDDALVALVKAAMIAGAIAGGGPAAGAAVSSFVSTPAGDALAKGVVRTGGGSATQMAMGGLVTSPTFALIGEAGPEMVTPVNTLVKKKRKTTKYQKELGRQLARQNKLHRLKNGSLRKGKTSGMLLSAAHKLTKRALGTKKGQVRKTARRAFRR